MTESIVEYSAILCPSSRRDALAEARKLDSRFNNDDETATQGRSLNLPAGCLSSIMGISQSKRNSTNVALPRTAWVKKGGVDSVGGVPRPSITDKACAAAETKDVT